MSPGRISILAIPPGLVTVVPPGPEVRPVVFVDMDLSFLGGGNAGDAMGGSTRTIVVRIFIPLMGPVPVCMGVCYGPIYAAPDRRANDVSFFRDINNFLFSVRGGEGAVGPTGVGHVPTGVDFRPVSSSSVSGTR